MFCLLLRLRQSSCAGGGFQISAADIQQILSGITVNFKPEDKLLFQPWAILLWDGTLGHHVGKTMADYLATDQVRTQIVTTVSSAVDTDDLQQQRVSALANKLGTNPDLQASGWGFSELMSAYQSQILQAYLCSYYPCYECLRAVCANQRDDAG